MENLKIPIQKSVLDVICREPGETLQENLSGAYFTIRKESWDCNGRQLSPVLIFQVTWKIPVQLKSITSHLNIKNKRSLQTRRLYKKPVYSQEQGIAKKEVINPISKKMKGRHELCQTRKVEIANIKQALAEHCKFSEYLQDLCIDLFKWYRKSCINNLLFQKSSIHKIHYAEDKITYTVR